MNVKLQRDENLSPRVAEILRTEDGLDAVHIRDRGLLEATDPEVLERAHAEDRVLATKNVVRGEQLRVLRLAVATLQGEGDLVNRVLRVWVDLSTKRGSVARLTIQRGSRDPPSREALIGARLRAMATPLPQDLAPFTLGVETWIKQLTAMAEALRAQYGDAAPSVRSLGEATDALIRAHVQLKVLQRHPLK